MGKNNHAGSITCSHNLCSALDDQAYIQPQSPIDAVNKIDFGKTRLNTQGQEKKKEEEIHLTKHERRSFMIKYSYEMKDPRTANDIRSNCFKMNTKVVSLSYLPDTFS